MVRTCEGAKGCLWNLHFMCVVKFEIYSSYIGGMFVFISFIDFLWTWINVYIFSHMVKKNKHIQWMNIMLGYRLAKFKMVLFLYLYIKEIHPKLFIAQKTINFILCLDYINKKQVFIIVTICTKFQWSWSYVASKYTYEVNHLLCSSIIQRT